MRKKVFVFIDDTSGQFLEMPEQKTREDIRPGAGRMAVQGAPLPEFQQRPSFAARCPLLAGRGPTSSAAPGLFFKKDAQAVFGPGGPLISGFQNRKVPQGSFCSEETEAQDKEGLVLGHRPH